MTSNVYCRYRQYAQNTPGAMCKKVLSTPVLRVKPACHNVESSVVDTGNVPIRRMSDVSIKWSSPTRDDKLVIGAREASTDASRSLYEVVACGLNTCLKGVC